MTPQPENLPAPPPVAAILITRNQTGALRSGLAALATRPDKIRVIVVDLASAESTVPLEAEFDGTQFIRLPKNFGITKAMNLGIRALEQEEYVLLATEPLAIHAEEVLAMCETLEQRGEIGALSPLLVDAGGAAEPQVKDLPSPSQPDPPLRAAQPGEDVPCAVGALTVRRFLLTSLQKLDERYGDYGGNLELCTQVRRAGKKVHIDERARAVRLAPVPEPKSLERADREIGTAAYLGKHYGLVTGILAHLKNYAGALFTLQLVKFRYLVSGQKVDGTQ